VSSYVLKTLIHRHKNKVFAYISLYIRDQALAEDIFQDTFLKVIQSVKAVNIPIMASLFPG